MEKIIKEKKVKPIQEDLTKKENKNNTFEEK